ncbi:MAG: hypothetical protein KIT31_29695 [Deltaproteobacteria bacterium]|nr:hypothetical protein [Deltaproteobacteria bacterium]
MTELARGSVADRPWGRTLGTLALRGLTGQLVLAGADGKQYAIAFQQGIVVAAWSPLQADAAVRLALTGGLVSSTQVAEIARRTAADPHRDEIEVISELVRLAPDQELRLRRRAIAQRAARTFSIDRGEFVVDDEITLPVVPGSELDIRSVIYIGAKQLLSEPRLDAEILQYGNWFRLRREILRDLPQFGFTDAERPVLDRLLNGAWLVELDDLGVEPRTARAIVYALAACNGCEVATGDAPQVQTPQRATPVPAGPRRRRATPCRWGPRRSARRPTSRATARDPDLPAQAAPRRATPCPGGAAPQRATPDAGASGPAAAVEPGGIAPARRAHCPRRLRAVTSAACPLRRCAARPDGHPRTRSRRARHSRRRPRR